MDPYTTPGLAPPPGVVPNFVDPYTLQPTIIGSGVVCLTVATIAVWMRMYTKLIIIKSAGWEDWTSFIAWAGFAAYTSIGFTCLRYGMGVHQWDVPLANVIQFAKLSNIGEILYMPMIFITKLSILLQYIAIFIPNHKRKSYYIIQALIWLNLSFFTALMFVEIFECVPREKIWDPTVPGHCVNIQLSFIVTAAINIVSDVSILVLPMLWVWKLQMETKQKLKLFVVFGTGVFACISSIMRLVMSVKNVGSDDETFVLTPVALWTGGEIASGIVAGCLPAMSRFFKHFFSSKSSSISSSNASSNKQGSLSLSTPSSAGQATLVDKTSAEWPKSFDTERNKLDNCELKEWDSRLPIQGRESGSLSGVSGTEEHEPKEFPDLESGMPGIRRTVSIQQWRSPQ